MVIVFGSINLDLIFPVPHIPGPGETVLGPSIRIEPGGKGANQAVAAARDGASVVMAGAVGRDSLAASALALLREANVDLTRVVETDTSTGCAAIAVDPAGDNAIAVGSGANLTARQTQIEDSLLEPDVHRRCCKWRFPRDGNGGADPPRPRERARESFSISPPPAPLPKTALREARFAGGQRNRKRVARRPSGLRRWRRRAPRSSRCRRSFAPWAATAWRPRPRTGVTTMPARAIIPVDTTAAGDCFVGVLAAALDRGATLTAALNRATAAAALCCTRHGSQSSIPSASETDAFRHARTCDKAGHAVAGSGTPRRGGTTPMNKQQIERAAHILVQARRDMKPLNGLPDELKPSTIEDAHAIQDAVSHQLGQLIAGFKAMAPANGDPTRGIIYGGTIHASPCKLPASTVPQCGVEGEVAFIFRRDLPYRATAVHPQRSRRGYRCLRRDRSRAQPVRAKSAGVEPGEAGRLDQQRRACSRRAALRLARSATGQAESHAERERQEESRAGRAAIRPAIRSASPSCWPTSGARRAAFAPASSSPAAHAPA